MSCCFVVHRREWEYITEHSHSTYNNNSLFPFHAYRIYMRMLYFLSGLFPEKRQVPFTTQRGWTRYINHRQSCVYLSFDMGNKRQWPPKQRDTILSKSWMHLLSLNYLSTAVPGFSLNFCRSFFQSNLHFFSFTYIWIYYLCEILMMCGLDMAYAIMRMTIYGNILLAQSCRGGRKCGTWNPPRHKT